MANIDITNVDLGSVELADGEFRDETLTFAGADTFAEGTILARRKVALVPTAGTVQGGTGTGTLTALAVTDGPIVPLVGVYVLTCIEAVAQGGVFRLVDPNGQIVAPYLPMMTASTGAAVIEAAGLRFTLTDATDFIVGNYFEITVAADGKIVPFDPAGAGGVQFPIAVLPYEVTKASSGDLPIRALVAGKVNKRRLVIDSGATITNEHLDMLRSYGIVPVDSQNLSKLDNQ
jgi:hypothetical protein